MVPINKERYHSKKSIWKKLLSQIWIRTDYVSILSKLWGRMISLLILINIVNEKWVETDNAENIETGLNLQIISVINWTARKYKFDIK